MKIAVLVQCHKNPRQIMMFLDRLKDSFFTIFLHIDKKSSIVIDINEERNNIIVLPEHYRVEVKWGTISQVDASLNLLRYASNFGQFDYYWLCSGQDYPIKTSEEIIEYFLCNSGADFVNLFMSKNNGNGKSCNYDKRNEIYYPNYILGSSLWARLLKRLYVEITGGYNKTFLPFFRNPTINIDFYFGSSWICLQDRTWKWIDDYLKANPEYYSFFKNCNCPDESFFHTLLMYSPYSSFRKDYLHFVEWEPRKNNPQILTSNDFIKIIESDKLMARKFDIEKDKGILTMIDNYLDTKQFHQVK